MPCETNHLNISLKVSGYEENYNNIYIDCSNGNCLFYKT